MPGDIERPLSESPMTTTAVSISNHGDGGDGSCGDCEALSTRPSITSRQSAFVFTVFLMAGTVSLLCWNSFLNLLPSLLKLVYPEQGSFTDTVTATYFSLTCLGTLLFTFVNISKGWILLLSLTSISILCFLLAVICNTIPGESVSLVMHFFAVFMGLLVPTVLSSSFGIASTFPKLYVGAVGSGMGFAGVFTLFVWMIFSHGIFPDTKEGVLQSIWCLMSISGTFSIATVILFIYMMRQDWVASLFSTSQSSCFGILKVGDFTKVAADSTDSSKLNVTDPVGRGRTMAILGVKGVFKLVVWNCLIRTASFFQTLLVFPSIGPVGWQSSRLVSDIIMGSYQIFDFLGRYFPNVLPCLVLKERTLAIWLIPRSALIVTFILSMKFPDAAVLGDPWFQVLQMSVLAVSNGLYSTALSVQVVQHVDGAAAKSTASAMGLMFAFVGVVSAQWCSKLLKVILLG